MELISANRGQATPLDYAKSSGITGIFKQPVTGPVQITALGLVDDTICDTENHGGVDQAIYLYGTIDYAWWAGELGTPLAPGTFGENLTISELESANIAAFRSLAAWSIKNSSKSAITASIQRGSVLHLSS